MIFKNGFMRSRKKKNFSKTALPLNNDWFLINQKEQWIRESVLKGLYTNECEEGMHSRKKILENPGEKTLLNKKARLPHIE